MMNEKMKLLIGYDGSEYAEAALDDLQRAGLPRSVEALIMSVTEVWLPPPPPSSYEVVEEVLETPDDLKNAYGERSEALKEAQRLAEQARERLLKNFPEWEVHVEATYGSPAWDIIMKADEWNPDLIVVGSHGRSALGRLVLGSVSQKVLTEARTSVRVARGRVEVNGSPIRIMVSVDGSESSEQAVAAVARRFWPEGTEARVVIVDDPLTPSLLGRIVPTVARWVEESNQEEQEWVQSVLGKAAEALRGAGLEVSTEVREGDPKKLLVRAAEEWHADSIFVGSTGFGNRFERFLLGSVSAAVAARAHCSVEVVRRKA